VAFAPSDGEAAWLWVVRSRRGDQWRVEVLPGRAERHDIAPTTDEVAVSVVARDGREGAVTRLESTAP
jgi:hypothetical protein